MTPAFLFNQRTGEYEIDKQEQVLVFPAPILDNRYQEFAEEGGVIAHPLDIHDLTRRIFGSGQLSYVDRGPAEKNPDLKQLIPYVVFVKGDKYFVYQRTKKGGESRLHNLYSLGVGGHINPCDGEAMDDRTYWRAMYRELSEEVSLTSLQQKGSYPIAAILYDASNDVGKVHFGVVHIFSLDKGTQLRSADPALSQGIWVDRTWLSQNFNSFENWSKLVISRVL